MYMPINIDFFSGISGTVHAANPALISHVHSV
jgi:hypothetical protein